MYSTADSSDGTYGQVVHVGPGDAAEQPQCCSAGIALLLGPLAVNVDILQRHHMIVQLCSLRHHAKRNS